MKVELENSNEKYNFQVYISKVWLFYLYNENNLKTYNLLVWVIFFLFIWICKTQYPISYFRIYRQLNIKMKKNLWFMNNLWTYYRFIILIYLSLHKLRDLGRVYDFNRIMIIIKYDITKDPNRFLCSLFFPKYLQL